MSRALTYAFVSADRDSAPACAYICIMDANVITEQLSMKINFKIQPPPQMGPLFQIFKYKVWLGIDLDRIKVTRRHIALKWKVSLNSNDAIACVHIGTEVGDLSPAVYVNISNAYQ